jgi:hypothetical protein
MFQQSQYEINLLQNKIGELVKENETLRRDVPSSNRKANGANDTKRTTRQKTKEVDVDAFAMDFPGTEELNGKACPYIGFSTLKYLGNVILFHIHSAFRGSREENPRLDEVFKHLIQALVALRQHLELLENYFLEPKESPITDLDLLSHFRAISRSFGMILSCSNMPHAFSGSSSQENDSGITFKFIEIVQQILESIVHISVKSYLHTLGDEGNKSRSNPLKGTERFSNLLVRLILELLTLLSPTSKLHFDIFEGFMYLILNQSAKLLYVLTFGHKQPVDHIEKEILRDQETFLPNTMENPETNRASSEAKYVFMVLKRLLAVAPSFYKQSQSNSWPNTLSGRSYSSRISAIKPSVKTTAQLPKQARQRLQETLVKCIWNDDNDPFFRDAIQRPSFTGNLPIVPNGTDSEKTGAWFVNELWQLIGWDILGQKSWDEV